MWLLEAYLQYVEFIRQYTVPHIVPVIVLLTLSLALFVVYCFKKKEKLIAFCFILIICGGLMNLTVILANGNKMPTAPMPGYDIPDDDIIHCVLNKDTKLAFLADTIEVPWGMASPGDVVTMTGSVMACGVLICSITAGIYRLFTWSCPRGFFRIYV